MPPALRVRFAPSPTGYLHIGGARTALMNFLQARRQGGTFVLRMEDTDQGRSTPESVQAILDGLNWLGIDWDEGPGKEGPYAPYFQMQRLDTYRKHADQLIAEGKAYRCYCTKEDLDAQRQVAEKAGGAFKYPGTCRERTEPPAGRNAADAVIRFKMPAGDGSVSFTDKALGTITKTHSDLDDWVMMRADGIPVYNFGCVIDDHLMDITLVARGQEHVNSTFPQLMLYQALGWTPPDFAHLPLILGPDREKLSKRKHPEADVMVHKRNGVMPEALLNFVIRLGWSHGNDEVISREQMLEWFDFSDVGTTSGVWNPEKLLWLNQQWMKQLPVETVVERLLPFLEAKGIQAKGDPRLETLVRTLRERSNTLEDIATTAANVYFRSGITLDEKAATKHLSGESLNLLRKVRETLTALPEWSVEALDGVVKQVSEASSVGMGKVAQPIRVALTGNTTSPGIGETLVLVGRDESLLRIDAALTRG
ncbi:glutamyl-tRNA synthetase [Myxococcus xanthus DK 1622]|uniref:Glutamate--tRNA ligase n=1 Tax=Myxococcus xanthus (strain DK1622) TaxID=246197 RepID=SYE_MYXXD|nr:MULTISPECIES: glutamate--tRNA ligase [Myxococcus]Q1D8Y1.1 RecName: Full=Glutamate--tRNA ligase; AltName: Full=Glutamyl-tRNA synthetase; Short=GluRS [Myxococcus xanthus DK 1622]ABF89409.1 glutamyl-tRNA synthetase [Myxococcus xanthus DK 1622]NOJ53752.1 glutamate--tRNA ligase [Myxococcus xanthus]QPM82180.1 glutamate--tRNA ligase [Myxococcus xanthus]QVW71428.1 glutamate--tRNA ligase [Myxococcus xanthus DZ2]UEO02442.1 glutamate--tRNA ligase [Myxococcus xanthus DZ2]